MVAINPQAGFGKRRQVGKSVVERLRSAGHEVDVVCRANKVELEASVTLAMQSGPDALVVVGGDGMVNLGANLVAGTGVPLGIVPTGTGNDMARGLGIPHADTDAAISLLLELLQGPARVIDAVRVTDASGSTTTFACVLSAGFDAIVNERANQMRWPRGRSRYNVALLRELARLRPIDYRLVLDGVGLDTRGLLVAVANNSSFGGGMRVAPHAQLDDGLLDVLVVRPLSRMAFLRIFPRVFAGTHVGHPQVTIHRARRVSVEADGVVAYADGERLGALPVEIEVLPGALRVLAAGVGLNGTLESVGERSVGR